MEASEQKLVGVSQNSTARVVAGLLPWEQPLIQNQLHEGHGMTSFVGSKARLKCDKNANTIAVHDTDQCVLITLMSDQHDH